MNGKIYMLTNTITGMKYIGQTTEDINERIRRGYAPTTRIGTAISTHGIRSFKLRTLKTGITTQRNLNDWENHYIREYGTISNGYNERLA